MFKVIRAAIIGFIAVGLSSAAMAQGFDTKKLFFGAGLSSNDVSGFDDGTGYQFFGGYGFGEVSPKVFIDAEVGYMDTGKMERSSPSGNARAKGLWATGVGRLMVSPNFELLGRLGLDFGDDDGLMFGVGGGLILTKNAKLRVEFVERDDVSSLQFNFVYQP
jgi:hypothetical protein